MRIRDVSSDVCSADLVDCGRSNAMRLMALAVPMWGWWQFPFWALVAFSCAFGVLQFTLYPMGAAFANDNVEPERRVGLSAILLMVYGLGACIGDRKSTRLNSSP